MRLAFAAGLVLVLLLAHAAEPARGASPAVGQITLRSGTHPGYERLVFDLPPGETGVMTQDGALLTLHFGSQAVPALPAGATRNTTSIRAGEGWVEITLAAGVQVRRSQLKDRLVFDLLDMVAVEPAPRPAPRPAPAAAPRAPSAAAPSAATGEASAPAGSPSAPPPLPARSLSAAASPAPASPRQRRERRRDISPSFPAAAQPSDPTSAGAAAAPVSREDLPQPASVPPVSAASPTEPPPRQTGDAVALAATATAAPDPRDGSHGGTADAAAGAAVLRLPFGAQTGAAAFRLGEVAMLVFDERRPIDAARLRDDPRFGSLSVQLLQNGTLLSLAVPPDAELRLSRAPGGWNIALQPVGAPVEAIRPVFTVGAVRLPVTAPGAVVSVPNPLTGGILLVGTQVAPGQGIAGGRRNPALALLPTWQGVAVDPANDAVVMRAEADAFVVTGDIPGRVLAVSGADPDSDAMADAARLTRRFDFPGLADAALTWRLRAATAQAAAAPPRGRTRSRLKVAEAMIALGLGAEAQALLGLTATDDPQAADDPDLVALTGVAALLAGRVSEAAGLTDVRLGGSDEMALWRALRTAMLAGAAEAQTGIAPPGGTPEAATVLATDARLLLSYPEPLRGRLLPLAAETLALSGETGAARVLVAARPDDSALDLARALLADRAARAGAPAAPALALYDRLAQGRDRLARLRAATAAIELRGTLGQMSAEQAATAMDRLVAAWRGDGRELALRLRAAALRVEAQDWRRGLALLRETLQAWPERRDDIQRRLTAMFAAALAADAAHPMAPLDLVSLAEENPDLVPDGEAGRDLAARLADRLAALDLPARAIPALTRLMAASPVGPVRGEFGTRLAAWQLQNHDIPAAVAALDASDGADLPGELVEARTLLRARAEAAAGRVPAALALLEPINSEAADELRAHLLEQAKDWPAATVALLRYAARTIPPGSASATGPGPPLDPAQARTVLRLASAAAQGGDETTLAKLRVQFSERLASAEAAHLFAVLTEPPVRDATELPRAARETSAARGISADARGLGAMPPPAANRPSDRSAPAGAAATPAPRPAPAIRPLAAR